MATLGDSAFVGGIKSNETSDILESAALAALTAIDFLLQGVMSNQFQSPERVLRKIKAWFSRLKVPLPAEAAKIFRLLTVLWSHFQL